MSDMLSQLDRESRLLMYLAGELDPPDMAEMERLLAADAQLRRELELLIALHGRIDGILGGAVKADEACVQRTLRALRRQSLAGPVEAAPSRASPRRRRAVIGYSLFAAAAAIALVIGLWGLDVFDPAPRNLIDGAEAGDLALAGQSSPKLDEADEHVRALHDPDDDDRLLLMM